MMGWLDWFALIALISGAVVVLIGVAVLRARLNGLRQAEAPRMKLAALAAQVENDPEAPAKARKFVALMADHAFDERFMTHVLSEYRVQARDSGPESPLHTQVREELGPHYGAIVYQAAGAFAEIMAATKPWLWLAAIHHRRKSKTQTTHDKNRARGAVWAWLHRHPDDGPNGGAPATA